MKQSKRYVVTGGIGSGKSEVCAILAERFPVLSADEISREVIAAEPVRREICRRLTDLFYKDGRLDRRGFANWVFADPERTKTLDEIMHPAIYRALKERSEELGGIVFCEIPLYFETGADFPCDGVLVVTADRETRIRRVMERDGLTREEVEGRISRQTALKPDRIAYTVVENNGDREALGREIDRALHRLFGGT